MDLSKLTQEELNKLYRKHKITARKDGGDDQYSWAVFVGGRAGSVFCGLTQREVPYYKRMALDAALKR